jgi:hypothetical protein
LLSARLAYRHWQHADDHRRRRHQHGPNSGDAGLHRGLKRRLSCKLLIASMSDQQN